MATDFRNNYDTWLATNPREDEVEITMYERALEKVEFGPRKDLVQAAFCGLEIRRPQFVFHEDPQPPEAFTLTSDDIETQYVR